MKRKIAALLSVVVLLLCGHYAVASTVYDEYKATIAEAEKMLGSYEKELEGLQAYVDAVDSGDQAAWEAARKHYAVSRALLFNKDVSELEAVQNQIKTISSMIDYEKEKINVSRHKMDLYFNAYIKKDTEAIDKILNNGYRTIPEDISDNIYLAWPYTEIPEDLLTDKDVFLQNRGNVYLATVTVIGNAYKTVYYVDINGVTAEASFKDAEVSEGEVLNIYFTPAALETETMFYLRVGPTESEADMYYSMQLKEEE